MCCGTVFYISRLATTFLTRLCLLAFCLQLLLPGSAFAEENTPLRTELLESISRDEGSGKLKQWYSGKVRLEGKWLAIEEAQEKIAGDERLAEYHKRRDQAINTASGNEKLARWCTKQKLTDLAEMHWMYVIRMEPNHRAALKELDMRWLDGKLMTNEEAEKYEVWLSEQKKEQKERKDWVRKVKRIQRDLEQGEPEQRAIARKQFQEINEPAAVPALLEVLTEEASSEETTIQRQADLMTKLGGIDDAYALHNLVEFAVDSPHKSVRYTAINQLKSKPYEDYVPELLSKMRMPIEASCEVYQAGNRIVSNYSYTEERSDGKKYTKNRQSYRYIPVNRDYSVYAFAKRRIPRQLISPARYIPERHVPARRCGGRTIPGYTRPAKYVPAVYREAYTVNQHVGTSYRQDPAYDASRRQTLEHSQADAMDVQSHVAEKNKTRQQKNERVAEVLAKVTGETLAAFPKSWWNWWKNYLEDNPGAAQGARQQLSMTLLNKDPRGLARGTWVWTGSGLQKIEQIMPGDYVLSQDPETGELAYQLVLAIAWPQELPVNRVDLADSSIHCAKGHVIWQAGKGWKRLGKLEPKQMLHAVKNEPKVEQIDEVFSIDCYDLIVDKSHTFFVGEEGVLVHDGTPVAPSYAALPGFSPAAVAHAEKLATREP